MNFEVGWISLVNNTIMSLFFLFCIVITFDEVRYSRFDTKKDKFIGVVVLLVLTVLFLWTLKAIGKGLGL